MKTQEKNTLLNRYLESKSLQNIINESAIFLNREHLGYSNPVILVQTLKQFIKLIKNIKQKLFVKKNFQSVNSQIIQNYKLRKEFKDNIASKPIFLCAENTYTKELLQIAIKKTETYYNTSSVIQVGDQTRLVKLINLQRSVPLVIFVGNPTISTIKFCLQHKIYVLSIFTKNIGFPVGGSYKVPMHADTIRRCFWLILLISLI